jgi:hypothetical protein
VSDTQADRSEKNRGLCINEPFVSAIAADIAREKPDFLFAGGDLVNGWFKNSGIDYAEQYSAWKKTMAPVYKAGIRIYAIRGNHDEGPERVALPPLPARFEPAPGELQKLKTAYMESFGRFMPQNGPEKEKGLTYSFIHKNALIIGLDMYSGSQHRINQKWLDTALAGNSMPHVFVFGHEPAFETNHRDNLSFYPVDRDLFWNSLGRAGAGMYFCGHDHFFNRSLIKDTHGHAVRQVIAGTGGGSLREWSGSYREKDRVKGEYHNEKYHGYAMITVEGAQARLEWRAMTGTDSDPQWMVMDSFTLSAIMAPVN